MKEINGDRLPIASYFTCVVIFKRQMSQASSIGDSIGPVPQLEPALQSRNKEQRNIN